MFLTLAELFKRAEPDQATAEENVFLVHPIQLSRWLDEAWAAARRAPLLGTELRSPFLGDDGIIDTLKLPTPQDAARLLLPSGIDLEETEEFSGVEGPTNFNGSSGEDPDDFGLLWHHLVYAYLIECTGVIEVFAEVLRRLVVGETLDALSLPAAEWARATEELFFREPPLFSIGGTESELRPYRRVNRRNVYWRMFGLDLPHSLPSRWPPGSSGDDQAWKQDTGTVNSGFRDKWTELLRQVWLGLENRRNETGPNPADATYVALLCRAIKDMLNMRRRGGLLAREEFVYVTVLSWFHLTLRTDTPIVQSLKADGTSPADRLAKIGQRVGIEPAPRARELFDLAEPVSALLRTIELGLFDDPVQAENLFSGTGTASDDMNNVINNWQSATGERVKDRPSGTVAPARPAQPLRVPSPGPVRPAAPAARPAVPVSAGAPSPNGQRSPVATP
jgi:hypothetical protein